MNRERMVPDFMVHALYGADQAREFIDLLSQGSTVPHFNVSDIGSVPIPVPSLPKQNEIVARLAARIRRVDSVALSVRHVMDSVAPPSSPPP